MAIYPPLRSDEVDEFEKPFNVNSEGVAGNGFYPQNSTSNDAVAGLERATGGDLVLKDGVAGSFTLTQITAANGTTRIDFLLDNEPIDVNITYTPTYTGPRVTLEEWRVTATALLVKSITYTYSSTKVSTEVRRVYASNGITIVGQVTVTYVYTGSIVTSATYVRNV